MDTKRTTHEGEHRWGNYSGHCDACNRETWTFCIDCKADYFEWSQGEIHSAFVERAVLRAMIELLQEIYPDSHYANVGMLRQLISEWKEAQGEIRRLQEELEYVQSNHVTVAEEIQRRHDACAPLTAEIERLREERDNAIEAEKKALLVIGAEIERLQEERDAAQRSAREMHIVADWASRENERLRQHDKEATDLTIDQQVEIGQLRTVLERIEAAYGQRLSAAELASMARQAL